MTSTGQPAPDGSEQDPAFSQALVESLPGVLYLYDRSGRFLKWNRYFEVASGYSGAEIARMQPLDFFDPKDHPLLTARIGEVFETGASSVEAEFIARDGSRTPYYFTGQRLRLAGRECLVGVGIDISERVAAERQLSDYVRQLRVLHAATDLFQDDAAPVERVLARLVDMAPRALRFPAIASARVTYGELTQATLGFTQTRWTMGQRFTTADGTTGQLEFAYTELPEGAPDRPFDAQEQHLLVSLSDMLRLYFDRRHAEQARREDESLLKMAERVARLGAWRVDLPGFVATWSDEVRAIYEPPPGVVPITAGAIDAYVPEDRPVLRAAVAACAEHGTPFDLELRLQTATRQLWVRVIGEPVRDESGAIVRLEGAIQDVTARRHAEDEARRLSAQVADTLESISDGLCTFDRAWRFTFVNREAERQISRPRDSLIGRVLWDAYPELAGTIFETSYRRAVETGEMVEFEAWFEPLASWFSVRAYPSGQGLAVYFHNITAQREAREQARISDERFRLVARATSDAIWDWNLSTGRIWWSEGIQTLFGYPADGIPSTIEGWEARIHPDDVARVIQGIHHAIDAGRESWTDEYRLLRHDGAAAHVVDRGYIIRDADGRPTRMIGGIADVTERKLLEAQFLRAQRLESIGTLAGGIAHDLNNVLSPLMMAVSILKAEEAPPDRASLLETIETSGRRGSEMVRQVLAFARGVEGQRLPVNVRHVFKDVEKILRETLPKNIEQSFTAPRDLWWVTADATQIHQVLMNLCVNARDAMPDGGLLQVEARNLVLDEVYSATMAALKPGPHVLVTVADTGTGMSRETQARVFEPFYTTKEVGKGTGLGLSTVLTIVKSHGGVVDLYSEPGMGTTFKIYFPAELLEAASPDELPIAPLPEGHGELVLVVDDEENVRALARKTLERHGYAVMEARHGAEAVALYAQFRHIALVLTDIAMPVMDGHAAAIALRSLDPRVRIIASSGHAAADAQTRGAGGVADAFIAKPYTAEGLLRAVDAALNGSSGEPAR